IGKSIGGDYHIRFAILFNSFCSVYLWVFRFSPAYVLNFIVGGWRSFQFVIIIWIFGLKKTRGRRGRWTTFTSSRLREVLKWNPLCFALYFRPLISCIDNHLSQLLSTYVSMFFTVAHCSPSILNKVLQA
uniref:Uncharacterized protein n=1 Tax=Parascaris univalens TaxID=6257 RepID=A0A915BXM7_PARUN